MKGSGNTENFHKTNMRMPMEMWERLNVEADARDLTVNWLVNRLLAEGLERLNPEMRVTR